MRVLVVAATKMEGSLGDKGGAWRGRIAYADELASLSKLLVGVVPAEAISSRLWLTSFIDDSTRRDPGELFFDEASDQKPVAPPPIVIERAQFIPVEPFAFVLMLGLWFGWRRWRRSRRVGDRDGQRDRVR